MNEISNYFAKTTIMQWRIQYTVVHSNINFQPMAFETHSATH